MPYAQLVGIVAISPLAMGIPFGVGQFLVAVVLLLSDREAGYEE